MKKLAKVLRLESLLVFVLSLYGYYVFGGSWLAFALLFFLFDASMVGYLKDNKTGAVIYNLGHSFALPNVLLLVSVMNDQRTMVLFAVVWIAHISLDRALGFGLKLDNFNETHLGKIGREKPRK